MDPSKFSSELNKAADMLRSHIDTLSFKRLSVYTSGKHRDKIGGTEHGFEMYEGNVTVPAGHRPDDKFYDIPIDYQVLSWAGTNRPDRVLHKRLLAQFSKQGGDFVYWFFQKTIFEPSASNRFEPGRWDFDSKESKIIRFDSTEGAEQIVSPPADYIPIFQEHVRIWINSSRGAKMTAARILEGLENRYVTHMLSTSQPPAKNAA